MSVTVTSERVPGYRTVGWREWEKANPVKAAAVRRAARAKWKAKNPGKTEAAIREWAAKNRRKIFGYAILRKYGLSLPQWDALLVAHCGRCAICARPMPIDINVDHDHATGRVRGLLCTPCNISVGHVEKIRRLNLAQAITAYLGAT